MFLIMKRLMALSFGTRRPQFMQLTVCLRPAFILARPQFLRFWGMSKKARPNRRFVLKSLKRAYTANVLSAVTAVAVTTLGNEETIATFRNVTISLSEP